MSEIAIKAGRGGARVGAGRKPLSSKQRIADGWYVYALCESPGTPFVKVGIAHKPYSRLSQAQTCNPRTLVFGGLWSLGSSDTYAAVERALHQALKPYHVRGEWFEVSVSDVERQIDSVCQSFKVEGKRVM